ncbi:hypothetical protein ACEPAF_6003 [Sanghuangporus sanghuang]
MVRVLLFLRQARITPPRSLPRNTYRWLSTDRGSNGPLIGVKASLRVKHDSSHTPHQAIFQEFDLTGRVAVVSGANRGLGLEIAQALAEAGAVVHCFDLSPAPSENWNAAADYISKLSHPTAHLNYASLDVTDQAATWAEVEKAAKSSGDRLDVCVASAGVIHSSSCLDYSAVDFSRVLSVDVNGVFFLAQASARQMAKSERGGSIILIASAAGSVATIGSTVMAYSTSKSAVIQMARSMACELGSRRIRVNTLSPGYIRTEMTSQFLDSYPQVEAAWSSQNPLGRLGKPEEMRGAAVWLASDASTYCTGAEAPNTQGDSHQPPEAEGGTYEKGSNHNVARLWSFLFCLKFRQIRPLTMSQITNNSIPPYVKTRKDFRAKYTGSCFCGSVKFEIAEDPMRATATVDIVKGELHGAPYQWAAIIHKDAVFFPNGAKNLTFYNSQEYSNEHKLPCKVLCSTCHSPLADEGRNMMLVFPVAINFVGARIPVHFAKGPRKSIYLMLIRFYGSRIQSIPDDLPKFLGKKGDRPIDEK